MYATTLARPFFLTILVAGFWGEAFGQATVPGPPVLRNMVLGYTTLTVIWNAPKNKGSGINRYKVTADPGTPDSPSDDRTCPSGAMRASTRMPSAMDCTLTGLTNGTAYTVRVVATHSAGDSTPSFSAVATPSIRDAGARIYVYPDGGTDFVRYPKLGSILTAVVEGRKVLPEYFRVRIIIDTQDNVDVIMRYLSDNGGQRAIAYKGGADDRIKGQVDAHVTVSLLVPLSNQPSVRSVRYVPGPITFQPPADPASPADPPVARVPEPPSFTDSGPYPQRYRQGRAIESLPLPAASTGNGTLTYTLTPDLPEGLTFTPRGSLCLARQPRRATKRSTP